MVKQAIPTFLYSDMASKSEEKRKSVVQFLNRVINTRADWRKCTADHFMAEGVPKSIVDKIIKQNLARGLFNAVGAMKTYAKKKFGPKVMLWIAMSTKGMSIPVLASGRSMAVTGRSYIDLLGNLWLIIFFSRCLFSEVIMWAGRLKPLRRSKVPRARFCFIILSTIYLGTPSAMNWSAVHFLQSALVLITLFRNCTTLVRFSSLL